MDVPLLTGAEGASADADDRRAAAPVKQNHHFIPCFYSKRWALSAGKLCEFSRKYKVVKPRWTSPKGTGYVPGGYAVEGVASDKVNRLEEGFYKPVDTRAAEALTLLEAGIDDAAWSPRLREAWTRFMFSLLLRMPEDMAILEASYTREFAQLTQEQEHDYAARRLPGWPLTLKAALAALKIEEVAGQSKELATKLMQNARISQKMSALHWTSVETSTASHRLLTSDRPVQLRGRLGDRKTTLILPIGPNRLFVGAWSAAHTEAVIKRGADSLVRSSNQAVTRAADRFVYGVDDGMLDFVMKHYRRERPKPYSQLLVEYVAAKRAIGR